MPRQAYVAADASGNATIPVVPVVSGVSANWLTVQSVDRAGNVSPELSYSFRADGILGIHGTNDPSAIGTDVSHGCIRMTNEHITVLANTLPAGTPVRVTRS